jgi:hypothetical protein
MPSGRRARSRASESVVREWLASDAPGLSGRRVLFTHALAANAHERADAISHFLGYIGDRPRVFLVRDPRDTIVSYFFQVAKRERSSFREGEIGRFVRDPGYGIDRLLDFLRACDHSLRADPGPALLVAYERVQHDPEATLRSVLEFLSGSASSTGVDEAVAFGRFENMRRLELDGVLGEPYRRLAARDPGDPESLKTRRGVVGGYREYLARGDRAYVEARVAALMPPALGYLEPGAAPETWSRGGLS